MIEFYDKEYGVEVYANGQQAGAILFNKKHFVYEQYRNYDIEFTSEELESLFQKMNSLNKEMCMDGSILG